MGRFQDYSIKRKLITITLSISSAALLLACAAFIAYDQISTRETIKKNLNNLAEVFAPATTPALEFDEVDVAEEYLGYLSRGTNQIVAAALYKSADSLLAFSPQADTTGQFLFAKFGRTPEAVAAIPEKPGELGVRLENGFFVIFKRIINPSDDEMVGTLFIQYDAGELWTRLRDFSSGVSFILLAAFALVFLLSTRFQRVISEPILDLAKTAGIVSENKDYSVRVAKHSNDEVGFLISRFNEMLAQIETRDRELKMVNEQLAESEKEALAATQAKSLFLANMSHELRTPLNAIIGYSELLQEEAVDSGQSDSLPDLERIHTAGKHLLGLINDILDLSKVEAGRMTLFFETFNVKNLVNSVSSTINPMVAKNSNKFEVICPAEIGSMHSDQTKVRQSLLNLLSNACKFTEKGTVRLEIGTAIQGEKELIEFRVTDSGIGMNEEQMGRLFQAFTQAEASTTKHYGGTGLGLALTKKFSKMLGGDLTVTSELGKGSTFTIHLPRTVADPDHKSVESAEAAEGADSAVGKTRILAIDDDPSVRDLIDRSLTKVGYHVETCPDGEQGLKMAKTLRPDIIILDVILPGIDGWSVLEELKNDPDLAKIPVIMVSFVEDQSKGFSMGVADYFTKPVDWQRLTEVLNRFRLSSGPMNVLVVEDDKTTRELLRAAVAGEGFQVEEAENGRDAIEKMKIRTPSLILLDLMMPVMNGFQFVEALHQNQEWRHIPIIVMTAKDISEEDRRALNGEVTKILRKGAYGMDELFQEIRGIRSTQEGATETQISSAPGDVH